MATKPFLNPDDWTEASAKLQPPSVILKGDEKQIDQIRSTEFSRWLQSKLLTRLSSHPDWLRSGPIALGSWSRDELAPKSDIDLLFVGDESAVLKLVNDFSKQGVKLRYRMPESNDDWTLGVEPFDVLALIGARALSSDRQVIERLAAQKSRLTSRWKDIRKKIVRAMVVERRERADRFDSITNYLEPNLKYGPGALRDLEQALALRTLFPERFESADDQHAFQVLHYYKRFFLLVRQRLHLGEGTSDLLTAPEQAPLARWLGFQSPRDFMREIQKGVARVSFYADWSFEKVAATRAQLKSVNDVKLETPTDLFKALRGDSSVLMQNRVRHRADQIFADVGVRKELGRKKDLDRLIGRELTRMIDPAVDEGQATALFRSRLIDHCVPEFRKIVGHVQHDQYHRFSVDAHILQAVRELGRLRKNPKLAGKLAGPLQTLTKTDWEILSFACLYHDIAKGRDGDHSVEGIAIAEHDLTAFGKSPAFIAEVAWIVEEHLILSSAAFRENPSSPKTWAKLSEKGVEKKRIPLLAAFTIVDIRATNPEAWTAWKERLLSEVVRGLENPESKQAIQFAKLQLAKLQPDWIDRLDPFLVAMLAAPQLSADLSSVSDHQGSLESDDLPAKVFKVRGGQTWIRFHSRHDRPGLFASYVAALSAAGLNIRHASIHTFPETGVYDWFEVKTPKTAAHLTKLISLALIGSAAPSLKKPVRFDAITLASESKDEWIVSFRGKDQPGALLMAATSIAEQGASVHWARVHTWGKQIDDVFGVHPLADVTAQDFVSTLRSRFA